MWHALITGVHRHRVDDQLGEFEQESNTESGTHRLQGFIDTELMTSSESLSRKATQRVARTDYRGSSTPS